MSRNKYLFVIFHILFCSITQGKYATAPGYTARKVLEISSPRGLFVDSSGDILVLSRSSGSIFALTESENEVTSKLILKAADSNINHAVVYHGGYIYASSADFVYRWPYNAGSRTYIRAAPEIVIKNVSGGRPQQGHVTRSLLFDTSSRLYVSTGSMTNVDIDSTYARIRRFNLSSSQFSYDFNDGEIFGDGLRNEVGLALDRSGTVWGVENGADQLYRADLGGDVHNGNPGEELHRFEGQIGGFHGYPYCFSTYNLRGYPKATQFAWPDFMNDGIHTDAWCKNPKNNIPPVSVLPAHTAPLGIEFHLGQGCIENNREKGAFPCSSKGDAFIGFHGSWNSDEKVGYKVSQIEFTQSDIYGPTGKTKDIIYEADIETCDKMCFRPVNAIFNLKGHMYISSDETNEIILVTYKDVSGNNGAYTGPILAMLLLSTVTLIL